MTRGPAATGGYRARAVSGVRRLPAADWDALFPGDAEGAAYYRACEAAPPPAFTFEAIIVEDADGRIVAGAPVFRMDYRLDTPLQGRWKPVSDWLSRNVPRLVTLPVMGLGSPLADRCHLGIHPNLLPGERATVVASLIEGLGVHAAASGTRIVAIKDLADADLPAADPALKVAGFTRVSSLPVAVLPIPEGTEEAYLATLSAATRKDIRRKLKAAGPIEVQEVTDISDLAETIHALYEETRGQSGLDYGDFERLTPDYFSGVMREMNSSAGPDGAGRAVCMMYRIGGTLIGFNLLLVGRDRVIDKFIGMRYPVAREHNLYVFSWMNNVRFCLRHGIGELQTGQTAYASKVRFGSRLDKCWVYFRHRNRVVNRLFKTFGPLMAFDQMDPDLKAMRK